MKNLTKNALVLIVLVAVMATSYAQQEEISKRELIALLELRAKTNGNQWTHTWDLSTPVNEWFGVKVKDGKVVAIDLANNNLKGNLPLTVGNLTNLKYLDLSNNQLHGRMPRELRKFDNLKYLNLSGNQFTGTLPMTLNRMADLVYLDLGGNHFEGRLPETITDLANLNSLVLADNNFTGTMPVGMEKMKKLERLFLAKNGFEDLASLQQIAQRQSLVTDVDMANGKFLPIDFSRAQKGTADLKFEDFE